MTHAHTQIHIYKDPSLPPTSLSRAALAVRQRRKAAMSISAREASTAAASPVCTYTNNSDDVIRERGTERERGAFV